MSLDYDCPLLDYSQLLGKIQQYPKIIGGEGFLHNVPTFDLAAVQAVPFLQSKTGEPDSQAPSVALRSLHVGKALYVTYKLQLGKNPGNDSLSVKDISAPSRSGVGRCCGKISPVPTL